MKDYLRHQVMDKICFDKSDYNLRRINAIGDEDGHPIENDIAKLEHTVYYDYDYNDRMVYRQFDTTSESEDGIEVFNAYLKSYDEIAESGTCIWLDACNLYKRLAAKYNLNYRMLDTVVYTDDYVPINQEVNFIIPDRRKFIAITFGEDGHFCFHSDDYETITTKWGEDEFEGLKDEYSLEDMNLHYKVIDITDMQIEGIMLSEFNNNLMRRVRNE